MKDGSGKMAMWAIALSKPIFAIYCTIFQKNNPGVRSIKAISGENYDV
jgi:hypothetical protein